MAEKINKNHNGIDSLFSFSGKNGHSVPNDQVSSIKSIEHNFESLKGGLDLILKTFKMHKDPASVMNRTGDVTNLDDVLNKNFAKIHTMLKNSGILENKGGSKGNYKMTTGESVAKDITSNNIKSLNNYMKDGEKYIKEILASREIITKMHHDTYNQVENLIKNKNPNVSARRKLNEKMSKMNNSYGLKAEKDLFIDKYLSLKNNTKDEVTSKVVNMHRMKANADNVGRKPGDKLEIFDKNDKAAISNTKTRLGIEDMIRSNMNAKGKEFGAKALGNSMTSKELQELISSEVMSYKKNEKSGILEKKLVNKNTNEKFLSENIKNEIKRMVQSDSGLLNFNTSFINPENVSRNISVIKDLKKYENLNDKQASEKYNKKIGNIKNGTSKDNFSSMYYGKADIDKETFSKINSMSIARNKNADLTNKINTNYKEIDTIIGTRIVEMISENKKKLVEIEKKEKGNIRTNPKIKAAYDEFNGKNDLLKSFLTRDDEGYIGIGKDKYTVNKDAVKRATKSINDTGVEFNSMTKAEQARHISPQSFASEKLAGKAINATSTQMKNSSNATRQIEDDYQNMKAEYDKEHGKLFEKFKDISKVSVAFYAMSRFVQGLITPFYELEKQVYSLGVVGGQTATEIKKIRTELLATSADSVFSAKDVAESLDQVVKTGQDMTGAKEIVKETEKLASASFESLDFATSSVNKALIAFDISSSRAAEIVNQYYNAAAATPLSLRSLDESLRNAASAFASITEFTNRGGQAFEDYKVEINGTAAALTGIMSLMGRTGLVKINDFSCGSV